MPPKKDGPSRKTVEKAKAKVIEDKTFGLKNKNKSKKVQDYVESVKKQVNQKHGNVKREQELAEQRKREKEAAEQAKKEMELLFKPVVQQPKIPVGVDPKSILCEFFKIGQCQKGDRCKFSHDLAVARKAEKIDLYTDRRLAEDEDTIDKWDQAKLETVVSEKQGLDNKNLKTKIVCKYFLDAIEEHKYGWFWECPNGGSRCMYQHCLPPGFVFQGKKKVVEEDDEEPTPVEELIEAERAKLSTRTPVTLENFLVWKEQKRIRKERERKDAEEKRVADLKAGRSQMSGRELFVFNPEAFVDDDEAIDVTELGPDDDDTDDDDDDDDGSGAEGGSVQSDSIQDNFPDGYDAAADQDPDVDDGGEGSSAASGAQVVDEGESLAVAVQENLFLAGDEPDLSDEDQDADGGGGDGDGGEGDGTTADS